MVRDAGDVPMAEIGARHLPGRPPTEDRLTIIAADVPRCEDLLTRAADLSRSDPPSAFALLRPGNSNAIRYLGPSFFTKFLYFAGGGAPDHPCLILDRVVATRLGPGNRPRPRRDRTQAVQWLQC
ncbi:hypothetical protein AB0E59_02580 [Lentzea sp. NPDC034063]|uniref:8-oxoguanine DNA glycosylase OGG fold protein n=1 Tax=unclassified Lentzea TaxID=2643253 RepID=UPI003401BF8C